MLVARAGEQAQGAGVARSARRRRPAGTRRTYPMGMLAAHLLGHVSGEGHGVNGPEIQGLEGIEKFYNARLKDTPGQRTVFCDGQRRAMFQEPDSYVAPKNGAHVVLTIDTNIQEKLEEQLKARVEFHNAECGVGVVMNPKTGEILALANYPTFDPAHAGNVPLRPAAQPRADRPGRAGQCVQAVHHVGGADAHAARRDGGDRLPQRLLQIGNAQLHDSHPYGALTVDQVLAKSSNIGMADSLGMRLGNARIYHTAAPARLRREDGHRPARRGPRA